jgi:hypothetical protein
MRHLYKTILLAVFALFVSCDDEFSLNADYEDITIIYGLLDPASDTTFLKINKAFLGDGNVLEMAKVEDSSIYKTDLSAIIEEYNEDNLVQTFNFDPITITNKEDGIFYNPNQVLYFSEMPVNEDRTYRLMVQVNNKTVTAETSVVNNFSITRPSAGAAFVRIRYDNNYTVEWNSARNGKRYEVYIRFNFAEIFSGSEDTIPRYIDWSLGIEKSKNTSGQEEMLVPYSGNGFYKWIEENVPYDDPEQEASVVARFTSNLEYVINVAAEELNTFMEVNEPSNSIVQTRLEYTNIDNGLGIFSSRFRNNRIKKIHPETVQEIRNLPTDLKFEF